MKTRQTIIPMGSCPVCFAQLDACSGTPKCADDVPTPGSYSVCVYCTAVLIFEQDMTLRHVSEAELLILNVDELVYLRQVQRAARIVVAKHRAEAVGYIPGGTLTLEPDEESVLRAISYAQKP